MTGFSTLAYILAAVLFILSLSGLSQPESAKSGNKYGIWGMVIAIVGSLTLPAEKSFCWLLTIAVADVFIIADAV